MGVIVEQGTYDTTVYSLDVTDPVLGGSPPSSAAGGTGVLNEAAQNLANRTAYLKAQVVALAAQAGGFAPLASPHFSGSGTVPDAPAGDESTLIANTEWVRNMIGGVAVVTAVNSATNLLSSQFGAGVIFLQGGLTAPTTIGFPNTIGGRWIVINNTSGVDSNGNPWQVSAAAVGQSAPHPVIPPRVPFEVFYCAAPAGTPQGIIASRGNVNVGPARSGSAQGQLLTAGYSDSSVAATLTAPCAGVMFARGKINLSTPAAAQVIFSLSMDGTIAQSGDNTTVSQFHEIYYQVVAGQSITARISVSCPSGNPMVGSTYDVVLQFQPLI